MSPNAHLKQLISAERIEQRVAELGARISRDFVAEIGSNDRPLILLGVLKGSFMFLADLVRKITVPTEIEFVSLSSYGNRLQSSGKVEMQFLPLTDLTGRHVLIVEDIVDTGRSLVKLMECLRTFQPKKISLCALLDKPAMRVVEVSIDYIGFEVPAPFVVGYGLDAAQQYRSLDGIYELETE